MTRQGGLGRGLSALLPAAAPGQSGLITLRLDRIVPNPRQPRDRFEDAALEELAQSIRQVGLLQPVLVRPTPAGAYVPGDIEIEIGEQQAFITLQDVGSGLLIGRRGATLDALQELVRCAIQRQTERRSHVRIDVEGYRSRQLDKLRDKCRDAIAEVRESGKPVRLEPMDAYERKMMHDLAASSAGVSSASEGNEPRRRVVIQPET